MLQDLGDNGFSIANAVNASGLSVGTSKSVTPSMRPGRGVVVGDGVPQSSFRT